MAEWPNALVLKTSMGQPIGGSNPSASATSSARPLSERLDSAAPGPGRLVTLAVFLMALAVYAAPGNLGRLFHDDAIFFYGGQEMVRGRPIYVGMFDHKGPLGQMICALGAWVAGIVGKDPLITTRYLFLAVASAAAAGIYAFATRLLASRVAGFLSAAFFMSFWGYGVFAFSGTRPKLLMTLFLIHGLVAMAHRRWFWAGMMITLSAFTWQPTGIYFFVALALAWFQSERDARLGSMGRAILGAAIPTVVIAGYFAAVGAFGAFIDGCFLFNVQYLENPGSFGEQLASMMRIFIYSGMGVPTVFGLACLPVMFAWRVRESGWSGLGRDRFACLLFTLPFPILWSLHDFQQYPDFFIFLPYVAVSLGWIAHSAASRMAEHLDLSGAARAVWLIAPGLLVATFAASAMRFGRVEKLPEQWTMARQFEERYGDAKVAVVGFPEALVLLDRPNVTRYGFIMRGIAEYIDANEPGGFAGWLQSISDAQPDVLIVDESYPKRLGEFADAWKAWLRTFRREPERIGSWSLYVPRDGSKP